MFLETRRRHWKVWNLTRVKQTSDGRGLEVDSNPIWLLKCQVLVEKLTSSKVLYIDVDHWPWIGFKFFKVKVSKGLKLCWKVGAGTLVTLLLHVLCEWVNCGEVQFQVQLNNFLAFPIFWCQKFAGKILGVICCAWQPCVLATVCWRSGSMLRWRNYSGRHWLSWISRSLSLKCLAFFFRLQYSPEKRLENSCQSVFVLFLFRFVCFFTMSTYVTGSSSQAVWCLCHYSCQVYMYIFVYVFSGINSADFIEDNR